MGIVMADVGYLKETLNPKIVRKGNGKLWGVNQRTKNKWHTLEI